MNYKHTYQRIVDDVVARIESGDLSPGSKLPSSRELQEQYKTSHMTVRTAVTILRDRGLVESVSGVGVFVRERRTD
ncbi:winged helix-turn-helix domain-containing protein [Micromonospora sp. NPDC006766]|uniref:winged helix-turn-helix domain-containing protein n=1 Tax=Micromonospora sp. NPDC006766 TaxID=3154778 RepID=UPI0033C29578